MKVAQHFSAGLAFLNASVPGGTVEFRRDPPKNGPRCYLSIVPSGTDSEFENTFQIIQTDL
jgi:hypothetical protein